MLVPLAAEEDAGGRFTHCLSLAAAPTDSGLRVPACCFDCCNRTFTPSADAELPEAEQATACCFLNTGVGTTASVVRATAGCAPEFSAFVSEDSVLRHCAKTLSQIALLIEAFSELFRFATTVSPESSLITAAWLANGGRLVGENPPAGRRWSLNEGQGRELG